MLIAAPLFLFRSWVYTFISVVTALLVLLPSSVIIYLHFQSTLVPQSTPIMKLQFQYIDNSGPFSLYNLSETAISQVKPWEDANKNIFTHIEQVLTIHMKYLKLTNGNEIGGIRLSVLNNSAMPEFKKSTSFDNRKVWPFKSINEKNNELTIFRADRKYKSWNEIIGKSFAKNVPFLSSIDENINKKISGLLDYIMPRWTIQLLVPEGLQYLFSWNNLRDVFTKRDDFKRGEFDFHSSNNINKNKYLQTYDLMETFGEFDNFNIHTFSTGFILFEGQLKYQDINDTSLLVELDTDDVFVVNAYAKLEYVLKGIRWWVYWWPGMCFLFGVGFIWAVSLSTCLSVSWGGYILWNIFMKMFDSTQKSSSRYIRD